MNKEGKPGRYLTHCGVSRKRPYTPGVKAGLRWRWSFGQEVGEAARVRGSPPGTPTRPRSAAGLAKLPEGPALVLGRLLELGVLLYQPVELLP